MTIICARLITGEELIAKATVPASRVLSGDPFTGAEWSVPDYEITLEDARIVTLQQVPGRGVGISFIPYTMSNPDAKVKLHFGKYVMSVYPPEQNLERAYIGENSQIQLATESSAAAAGIRLK